MHGGMFYMGARDAWDADLAWLAARGWNAVIGVGEPELPEIARAHGMAAWTCLGAFAPPEDDPALLCLDVNGQRQRWFGSGCPNHPAVRASSLERHRIAAAQPQVAGIFLDGIRFASPASGLDAFCTCFCEHCERTAAGLGLDFARMRREVTALHQRLASGEPLGPSGIIHSSAGVRDWLWFRQRVITDFVEELARVIRRDGTQLGAYLFSPCLAPLVGQDYAALAPYLDVVAPMLYRNVNEPACIAPINTELHILATWATQAADCRWVLEFAGLPGEACSQLDDLLTRGVSPEAVGLETARARACIGADVTLAPILWWDDPLADRTMACAREAGVDGVQVFRFIDGIRERWDGVTP